MEPSPGTPPQLDPSLDDREVRLLALVNESLAEFSTAKYKRLPEIPEGCEALRGKSIAMVDDGARLIQNFIPHLVSATEERVIPVVYTDQTPDDLAQGLIARSPDVVLMDYRLGRPNDDLWGSDMVAALRRNGYAGIIIGFSSDSEYDAAFLKAGADTTAKKEVGAERGTLKRVADAVARVSAVK